MTAETAEDESAAVATPNGTAENWTHKLQSASNIKLALRGDHADTDGVIRPRRGGRLSRNVSDQKENF